MRKHAIVMRIDAHDAATGGMHHRIATRYDYARVFSTPVQIGNAFVDTSPVERILPARR